MDSVRLVLNRALKLLVTWEIGVYFATRASEYAICLPRKHIMIIQTVKKVSYMFVIFWGKASVVYGFMLLIPV